MSDFKHEQSPVFSVLILWSRIHSWDMSFMFPLTLLFHLWMVCTLEGPQGLFQLLQKPKGQRGFGSKMCGPGTNEIIKSFKRQAAQTYRDRASDEEIRNGPGHRFIWVKKSCIRRPNYNPGTSIHTQWCPRKQALMRTSAYSWKKNPKVS